MAADEVGYLRVVVEEQAKPSPCVWIAPAGLEFGHHPRWALLRRGNHFAISLAFSSPLTPSSHISLHSLKKLCHGTHTPLFSYKIHLADFF